MSDKIEQLKQWYEQEQIRIKQEFDSKLKELEEKELETLIRRVGFDCDYWSIVPSNIFKSTDTNHLTDKERLNVYNYYPTFQEAQKVQARELLARKVFLARSLARKDGNHDNDEWLPDWSNAEQIKYCIDYDTQIDYNRKITVVPFYTSIELLSFKNQDQVKIFRKYISDEEIRQFLEG